jgi:hypothetical protein
MSLKIIREIVPTCSGVGAGAGAACNHVISVKPKPYGYAVATILILEIIRMNYFKNNYNFFFKEIFERKFDILLLVPLDS